MYWLAVYIDDVAVLVVHVSLPVILVSVSIEVIGTPVCRIISQFVRLVLCPSVLIIGLHVETCTERLRIDETSAYR